MSNSDVLEQRLSELLAREELSDIHVEVGQPIWIRESGGIHTVGATKVTAADLDALLQKQEPQTGVKFENLYERLAEKGDLDFAFAIAGRRMRANLFRANGNHLCLALRRIPEVPGDWAKLGLPISLKPLFNRSKGLFLVTGPTGSGKSSTLAAILEYLNTEFTRHILTIEDPIEYVFEQKKCLIQQRQIGREAPSFPLALRAALREDPDVIMLGELRDMETIETALHAANTGHLVLGTLHTPGAKQAVERIELVFPETERRGAMQTLSSVLIGVLSQALIPRANGPGRVLAYELMLNNDQMRTSIKESKLNNIANSMEMGRKDGQLLLNRHLVDLIRTGVISKSDGLYFSYDPLQLGKDLDHGR
jgi:twitching motility protein PilT